MIQLFRLVFVFAALTIAILAVHQWIRIEAADYIIGSTMDIASAVTEWERSGQGTRLLLQLFGAGAVITILSSYLRIIQGQSVRPTTSSEALTPLTNALLDLKKQEQKHLQEKGVAVARMTEMRAVHTTVLDGIGSGVLTVDEAGRVATCNPAARTILGWERKDPEGRPVTEVFRGSTPDVLASPTYKASDTRRMEFNWNPPGRPHKVLGLSLSKIETPAGTLNAVLFTDLTEMTRLKQQVELRRHLTQLGEVSAGIAHEFRNNMGAVLGYARLIAHDVPKDAPTREVVDAMMNELVGMEGLIRDLLDFSRSEEPHLHDVPVAPLLEQAVLVGSADFDMDVGVGVATDLPALNADESRVKQSLINLVRNACEAAQAQTDGTDDKPRVMVTAKAEKGDGPSADPEWVIIQVSDNGVGISEALSEKIFLPFFTTRESGTGMGLAYVHKCITSHGGDIDVVPTPGGGATFKLRLPTVFHKQPPEAITETEAA